jgi:hypothetical protein
MLAAEGRVVPVEARVGHGRAMTGSIQDLIIQDTHPDPA